jgi:aspartyl-tRNA(Asn)/glutamyl-tRNA(Gln) amidotransferase subunit C
MVMKISEDDVRYVARLARLRLDDNRIREMSETLSGILTYIDKLNEVDTRAIPPTSYVVNGEPVFREDYVEDSLLQDEALQNAPDRVGAFYRVPKIIE